MKDFQVTPIPKKTKKIKPLVTALTAISALGSLTACPGITIGLPVIRTTIVKIEIQGINNASNPSIADGTNLVIYSGLLPSHQLSDQTNMALSNSISFTFLVQDESSLNFQLQTITSPAYYFDNAGNGFSYSMNYSIPTNTITITNGSWHS